MRGEVKPGARCLIVGPITSVNHWLGVEVIVVRVSQDDRLKAYAAFYPGERWWHCRAADCQPRICQNSEGGDVMDVEGFTAEKFLMPLDPPEDIRAELHQQATIHPRQDGRRTVRAHTDCATTGST